MTSAHDFLAECRRRGLSLRVVGDRIRVAPAEAVTDDLREAAQRLRPQIIGLLAGNGAEVSPATSMTARVAAMLARVDALAPGRWNEIMPAIRRDAQAWAAIARGERAVNSAAAERDERALEAAIVELEQAWRTAVERVRVKGGRS